MTRNVLYALVGALIVICVGLGYHVYQQERDASGVEINLGKGGVSINKN